jgi:hypothetical protein
VSDSGIYDTSSIDKDITAVVSVTFGIDWITAFAHGCIWFLSIYSVGMFKGKLSAKIGGDWRFFRSIAPRISFWSGMLTRGCYTFAPIQGWLIIADCRYFCKTEMYPGNSDKLREDLVSIWSRQNYLKLQKLTLLLSFWLSIFPNCFGSFFGLFCLSWFFANKWTKMWTHL